MRGEKSKCSLEFYVIFSVTIENICKQIIPAAKFAIQWQISANFLICTVRRYNLTAEEQLFRWCVSGFNFFYRNYPKYCMRYGIVLKHMLSILPSQC